MGKFLGPQKIISRAAAALCAVCIAAAVFGVEKNGGGLRYDNIPDKFSPRTAALSAGENSGEPQVGSGETSEDTSRTPDSQSEKDLSENVRDISRLPSAPEENSESGGEDSDNNTDADASRGNTAEPTGGGGEDLPRSPELPSDSPSEGEDTDERLFTTSIVDGERVSDAEYGFTVTHLHSDYRLKNFIVKVNGAEVKWTGSVTLSERRGGKNNIRIYASYADPKGKVHSGYAEYTVWLGGKDDEQSRGDSGSDPREDESGGDGKNDSRPDTDTNSDDDPEPDGEPRLVTDLTDFTTSEESITFSAKIKGGENARLKVYLGGQRLDDDGSGTYTCALAMGINTVRLKGSAEYNGEVREFGENYEIRRIAKTTPETAPTLAYSNVPESVRGNVFTLDLVAQDFSGNRIYDDGIAVVLNGRTVKCSWVGEYTSYKLDLSGGENSLEIRVTDGEGRYADYSYIIECTALADGDVIGVSRMTVDAAVLGLGELCAPMEFEIKQGESALDGIVRSLEQAGFTAEVSNGYLAGLGAPNIAAGAAIPDDLMRELEADDGIKFTEPPSADMLRDRDFTSLSGWMISVNGHFVSFGMSDLHLKDGDELRLRFSLASGRDIGDSGAGECYAVTY